MSLPNGAIYRLRPIDPLVFRSGKPFGIGSSDGGRYPLPSAWAGLLRTRYMDAHDWPDAIGADRQATLLSMPAHGAFLVGSKAGHPELYLPKPSDAIAVADHDELIRIVPQRGGDGTGSDLPSGLLPVGPAVPVKGKPVALPPIWPLALWNAWARGESLSKRLFDFRLPPAEQRTHVAIDPDRQAAADGQLFRTEALDYRATRHNPQEQWLLVGRGPAGLPPGLVCFGGERRLSHLDLDSSAVLDCPAELARDQRTPAFFALTLASMAMFRDGWRPGWLDEHLEGAIPDLPSLRVRLIAAQVERWEGVSGWDLHRGAPKPTRRAVAAGATYWFQTLSGQFSLANLWLHPISDLKQDRDDGFGLAIPRPWSGVTHADASK